VQVEIITLVCAVSKQNVKFLLCDTTPLCLPHTYLIEDDRCCEDVAAGLLSQYTGLQAKINGVGWVPLEMKGIFDKPNRRSARTIGIGYIATIPEAIPLRYSARWLTYSEITSRLPLEADHHEVLLALGLNY
jgi:hypothetical protein